MTAGLHCVSKNIPHIIYRTPKKAYQILIIFDMSIPDTTSHQMSVQFLTSIKTEMKLKLKLHSKNETKTKT